MSLSEATLSRPRDEIVPMAADFTIWLKEPRGWLRRWMLLFRLDKPVPFPDDAMRTLMAALIKVYAAKFDEGQRPALLARRLRCQCNCGAGNHVGADESVQSRNLRTRHVAILVGFAIAKRY